MTGIRYCNTALLFLFINTAFAATNPIDWTVTAGSIPAITHIGTHYQITYRLTSNLPFTMPTPLMIGSHASSNEFTLTDQCSQNKLGPRQSCTVTISFTPTTTGNKNTSIRLLYGNNTVELPALKTTTVSATSFIGLIGVDYNPNHYPNGNQFNGHDVFYTGTANNNAISNTYMEMAQLKAAGFTAVRSYQTVEYAWIDIITQANALGMQVVYEANIPYNGNNTDITNAVTLLDNVITAVTPSLFNNTVILVLAGHENYNGSNVNYLKSAVTQLQAELSARNTNVPVSSALVSGNLVTPGNPADIQTLINSYSPSAPLGFDPYPFQWGVTPPNQAATNAALINSIAWDYAQVMSQSFYVSPRPILMAESGWATAGSGQFADYFCYIQGNCAPSISNAAAYLTALYGFVNTPSNVAGLLVFEAYDEPAKDPTNPTDAENFYGVFDSNCNLKGNNTGLLPNPAFSTTANFGCQGYINGGLFSVVGSQPGALTNQPPFTVEVTQTNPTTGQSAAFTVTVPNQNRTNSNIYPWPQYLAFNGATITITGLTSGASCSTTATVANSTVTFGTVNCTNMSYLVSCSGNICYLPWNNF